MNKALFALIHVAAFTAALISNACFDVNAEQLKAYQDRTDRKVVMIVADYLDIEDIKDMDFLSNKAYKSCIALMNNRQPVKAGASKSKLIIGSGKRLELNINGIMGSSKGSISTKEQVGLIYTDTIRLKSHSNESEYQKFIGYLGNNINKYNGTTCFIGNSDTTVQNRSSMLIAMDSSGEVDSGETEGIIIEDERFPYGKRTDYNKLAELYKQYLAASSFVLIETGDLERLEALKESISENSYETYKHTILDNIDDFTKELISYGNFNTLVFISTFPSKLNYTEGNRLTPVVVIDASEEGILYSDSTRRDGIILNTDLADYILCKLGYLGSSALAEHKRENAVNFLESLNWSIVRTSTLRTPVLTSYAVMIIAAIVILFITVVFIKGKHNTVYYWISSIIANTMLVFPLLLLYMPTYFLGESPLLYMTYVTAASAALSIIIHITLKGKVEEIFLICLLLLIGLSIDIISGSPFMKQSVFGYDPVIGARFYGIGNEYAGMFIGCSLMVIGCLRELFGNKLDKIAAIFYFILCILLLGLTTFGANFGGAAAAALGYILAYFLVYDIKFSKRNVAIGLIILIAAAVILIAADSLGISSPSHIGGIVKETESNGFGVIISTIRRKISMNLRLVRYTVWTKVLICIIAAIAIMLFKPVKLLRSVFKRHRYLKYSWISIAAASILGFAVNDSGIVLAATAMIYAAFTMLIMCIGERDED